uniref:Uncharacterized protein n=1 Tax=Tanacetum cinerariifolium TaxID=118510 RepID=A0A6L2P6D7_TANCI|nr:hypothetical protein [Tanacetum cinerariifolium]
MSGDPAKKVDSNSSSYLNLTFGDPLYLHPIDTGGSPIVTIKLTRTDNYKDDTNPALANQWDMCNFVVFTWILNSLSPDLYAGAMYAKTASELWTDLKDTYDKVDGSDVFNLHKSINSLSQSGASLSDHYNNFNSLWKQFDAMISLPACTCDAAKHFKKHNQLIKLVTSNNSIVDPNSNNAGSSTTSNSLVSLSNDQLTRLMNLLNDNGVSSANANMSVNVVDISNLGLTVGHPNEYTVSLLSVHKLSRDNKLFVGFDERRVSFNDDGTELSPDVSQGNNDSGETSMDEKNNTHPKGTFPNETDFINDFYEHSELNYDVEELHANTVRRSSRHTKLPSSLNDFIIEGKVKYGVERVVNYVNLNHDNYCFIYALNKNIEPTCYKEAVLDSNWIDVRMLKLKL